MFFGRFGQKPSGESLSRTAKARQRRRLAVVSVAVAVALPRWRCRTRQAIRSGCSTALQSGAACAGREATGEPRIRRGHSHV